MGDEKDGDTAFDVIDGCGEVLGVQGRKPADLPVFVHPARHQGRRRVPAHVDGRSRIKTRFGCCAAWRPAKQLEPDRCNAKSKFEVLRPCERGEMGLVDLQGADKQGFSQCLDVTQANFCGLGQ